MSEINMKTKVLCSHDGVLLKSTGYNTSGALNLIECLVTKELYLEWRPNESILIADESQDQGEWALVDTISHRSRSISESPDSKKMDNSEYRNIYLTPNSKRESNSKKEQNVVRIPLNLLRSIEVRDRGQTLHCITAMDRSMHSEYFFQHGNADLFLRSMLNLHVIEYANRSVNNRNNRIDEIYEVLNVEHRKLKKTFAELDIGDIKMNNQSWLSNRVVGFLANIPEYISPPFNRSSINSRPLSIDNYEIYNEALNLKDDDGKCEEQQLNNLSIIEKRENVKDDLNTEKMRIPVEITVKRGLPLTEKKFLDNILPDGRVSNSAQVCEIIFHGGVDKEMRCEIWKYLLNYYKWEDTYLERIERRQNKSKEYYAMKAQWMSMTSTQEANFTGYRERKSQIEKDVKRTDRTIPFFSGEDNPNLLQLHNILMTYVMYNFDLGYVQGMSDLLAPILSVQENEVDAFWCFVGFMDMVSSNFDIDQAGMKLQFRKLRYILKCVNPRLFFYMLDHDSDNMYFCFRWILVWYKREFSYEDILKLWECLWTKLPGPNYHLLISIAILEQQTDIIISNKYEFTDILKHINELSGNIDLENTLLIAESIYRQYVESSSLENEISMIMDKSKTENGKDAHELNNSAESKYDAQYNELLLKLKMEKQDESEKQLEEACERAIFLQFD